MTRWWWLEDGAAAGAEQMAVDAGLLDRARATGDTVMRVFAWDRPTLSFGRHESVRDRFDAAMLERAGVGAVRRPTGGRVLLHVGEVTYSVTCPVAAGELLRDGFRRVNALLTDALARLGVSAATAGAAGTAIRPGSDACFAAPSSDELVVDGRKLVASAQRQEGGALLQHGSILLADRQARIVHLARAPMRAPAPGATLSEILGRELSRNEVAVALRDAAEAAAHAAGAAFERLDAAEVEPWTAPHRPRFADPEWTWRR